jgi:methyltransferase-like protein 6
MLSAVSPAKMAEVIINLKQVLKPGGHVLVRDYAMGDLAQERLTRKDQKISENFFARGDGTVCPSLMNCDILFQYYYIGGWDYEVVESFQLPDG